MAATLDTESLAMPPLWMISLLPALGLFASAVHLPSIPAMASAFSVTPDLMQYTVTVYLGAMAAFSLVVGPLSDRLGRRPVALLMLAVFLIGSVAALFSATVPMLLAARLLQGIGASGGLVLSRSMVKDALNGQMAAKAAAQVSMAVAVAPMLAPLFGGYIQELFGWRANFVVVALFAVALLALATRRLVETLPGHKRFVSSHWSMLVNYVGLLGMRKFHVHTLPVMCGAVGLFTYQTGAPVLLIGHMDVSPADYGVFAAMPALGFMMGTFTTTRIALHTKAETLIEAGCVLFIASGMLIVGLSLWTSPGPWSVAIPMVLFGAGNGLLMPTATIGGLSAAPLLVGSAAALISCLRMGAGSAGSYIITKLPPDSVTALGSLVFAAGIMALLSWVYLGRGKR
ncbi:MAG TPA: multidrug effflux MFS transporter [Noviherbaspirillum sp.]|jgi:DHA1 family bicyclomycin/chloramphenicol resistance-like MFS transporter|uniref:multidrug effflux MFS transporter n=1 Tax=Noviherbaspirillum sp. TaxID=1926288 RepID=UPI002DDDA074|nr:multidrug effflux MFS transporter [Noviherbaspirillum sp.]HEV2611920.1 multidrug effflux MFS transporter [Noviherbaspirillum sp.]